MQNIPLSIDALLNQTPFFYWNYGDFGQGVTITFNFPDWQWFDDPLQPASPFTPDQASYAISALQAWCDVADIQISDPGSPSDSPNIQFRMVDLPSGSGKTFYPHSY